MAPIRAYLPPKRGERTVTRPAAAIQAEPLVVLIPSPLLGPFSWSLVAGELEVRGWQPIIPADLREPLDREPAWRQTTDGVVASLRTAPSDLPVVLIGHSNAGPLLPAIGRALPQPIVTYLFVDARLPHGGMSRLDAVEAADPDSAAERRTAMGAGRRYPTWTDEDLRELVPDPERRRAMLAELRPRGAEYWTEPLPMVYGWPDAPCAYLLFSSAYRSEADRARRAGWPTRELPAGHFHQLVDPPAVAEALLGLIAQSDTRVPSGLELED
jgi:hypothetical protein